jgi:septal ring factor EnvC (AmiA/AmiB activator)
MSGLNISIINNIHDALRYINPVTEAEVVLYDLLKNAEENDEIVNDDVDNLKDEIDGLKDEIDDLEYELEGIENDRRICLERNTLLFDFFDKINDAYNDRLGNLLNYHVEDDQFLQEIVAIIKQNA